MAAPSPPLEWIAFSSESSWRRPSFHSDTICVPKVAFIHNYMNIQYFTMKNENCENENNQKFVKLSDIWRATKNHAEA